MWMMLKRCRILHQLPKLVNFGEDRLFHVACITLANTVTSNGINSFSKQNPFPKFPRTNVEKLAQCGCINDTLHDVSIEQFCERMKVFGGVKYLNALRILKDLRYLKTGRLLLKHLISTSSSLPAYVVLEMAEMLACLYMEEANQSDDEELWRELSLKLNKVPNFLRPTVSLLLKSCCPVNIVPKLPSNLMSRPVVITALLGNYIRYGKMDLFAALLEKETNYDLSNNDHLLRIFASYTNSHSALSSGYLHYLAKHSVILSDDNIHHFNSIVRESKHWNISVARILDDGNCSICGEKFKENEDLTDDEFSTLKNEIMRYMSDDMKLFTSATDQEIANLRKHIKQKIKPSTKNGSSLVVDALNVLYTGMNNMKSGFGFDEILQKSLKMFGNVLLIVRKGGDTQRIWNKRDQFSDSHLSAFFCHRMSSDDLFVLLAVMEIGMNAYFLTNDHFLNHRSMLSSSGQSLFDRWVDRRAIRLDGRDVVMPSKFAPYIHETEDGFHVPVKTVYRSVASYSFLCTRRK